MHPTTLGGLGFSGIGFPLKAPSGLQAGVHHHFRPGELAELHQHGHLQENNPQTRNPLSPEIPTTLSPAPYTPELKRYLSITITVTITTTITITITSTITITITITTTITITITITFTITIRSVFGIKQKSLQKIGYGLHKAYSTLRNRQISTPKLLTHSP